MKIFTTAFTSDRKGWPISLVWWAVLVCSVFWATIACATCTSASELDAILAANQPNHSLSTDQATRIPVYQISDAQVPSTPVIGSNVRASVATADGALMNVVGDYELRNNGQFYSFTIQLLPAQNGVRTARISLWPASDVNMTTPSRIWLNRLGGIFS